MAKYGTADFGEIDIVEILTDLMDVMKENKIVMPHGLTMLARGLTHMEGYWQISARRSIWCRLQQPA